MEHIESGVWLHGEFNLDFSPQKVALPCDWVFLNAFPTDCCESAGGGDNLLYYKFLISFFFLLQRIFLTKKENPKEESMQTTAAPLQQGNSPANRTLHKEQFKRNEQSLDYILRSGAAGGIAGCLV